MTSCKYYKNTLSGEKYLKLDSHKHCVNKSTHPYATTHVSSDEKQVWKISYKHCMNVGVHLYAAAYVFSSQKIF
jgi:hypothetical protein